MTTGRSSSIDDRLAAYLDREEEAPVRLIIDSVRGEVRAIGLALLEHQRACDERWTRQFVALERRVTNIEATPPCRPLTPAEMAHARAPQQPYPEYHPAEDSRGNMVVPMVEWQALQIERASEKGQRVGSELALSKVRGGVKFWAALVGALGALAAWTFEHFRPK